MSLGMGAAIIGVRLRDPGSGHAVFVVVQRTGAVLATLPARFRSRLPSGTVRRRALREREHTGD